MQAVDRTAKPPVHAFALDLLDRAVAHPHAYAPVRLVFNLDVFVARVVSDLQRSNHIELDLDSRLSRPEGRRR